MRNFYASVTPEALKYTRPGTLKPLHYVPSSELRQETSEKLLQR